MAVGSLSQAKGQLRTAYRVGMAEPYRQAGVDVSGLALDDLATLSLELAGVDVAEVYSPQKYCAMASSMGLRPGISADLVETKPDGNPWNFMWDSDVEEWFTVLEEMDPYILIGTPPCEVLSQLQTILSKKRDPADMEAARNVGLRHLWVACES